MPEEMAHSWQTMTTGAHPWEDVPFLTGGRTEINATVNMKDVAAGKANVGYTMSLNTEGSQPVSKNEKRVLGTPARIHIDRVTRCRLLLDLRRSPESGGRAR